MQEYYYNVGKLQWQGGEKVKVYKGNTDLLLLKVKTENILDDLSNGKHKSSGILHQLGRLHYNNWHDSIINREVRFNILFHNLVQYIMYLQRTPNPRLGLKSDADLTIDGLTLGDTGQYIAVLATVYI